MPRHDCRRQALAVQEARLGRMQCPQALAAGGLDTAVQLQCQAGSPSLSNACKAVGVSDAVGQRWDQVLTLAGQEAKVKT